MSNIDHVTSYVSPVKPVTLVAIRPTAFACKPQTGLYQEKLILCIGLIKLFSYVSLASFSYRSAVYYFTSAFCHRSSPALERLNVGLVDHTPAVAHIEMIQ